MRRSIPSNSDNVIDSRDIIARLEELESERQDLANELEKAEGSDDEEAKQTHADNLKEWDEENTHELDILKAINDDSPGDDWWDGATLVRDTYFTKYCQELVSDIGDLPNNIPGYLVIDWDATADNLQQDYTSVEFDGVTYYVR